MDAISGVVSASKFKVNLFNDSRVWFFGLRVQDRCGLSSSPLYRLQGGERAKDLGLQDSAEGFKGAGVGYMPTEVPRS